MSSTLKSWGTVILTVIAVKACFAISRESARVAADTPTASAVAAGSPVATPSRSPRPDLLPAYERKQLAHGIEIDVPKAWEAHTEQENGLITLAGQSAVRQSGIDIERESDEALLSYHSLPRTTYATVRVKRITPASVAPADLQAASDAEVAALGAEMKASWAPTMERQGQAIIGDMMVHREQISGHPAVVIEYQRGGAGGPVNVRTAKLMGEHAEVIITTSYRESERPLWQSVIDVVEKSLNVPATL